jgi:hypothetical protein
MIIQYRVEGFTAKAKKLNKYKGEELLVSAEQKRIAKPVLDGAFEVHS